MLMTCLTKTKAMLNKVILRHLAHFTFFIAFPLLCAYSGILQIISESYVMPPEYSYFKHATKQTQYIIPSSNYFQANQLDF